MLFMSSSRARKVLCTRRVDCKGFYVCVCIVIDT